MKSAKGKSPARRPAARRSATFTLSQVASAVGGRVVGDASLRLTGVRGLAEAEPSDLSWVSDDRRAREVGESRAGAVLAATEEQAAGKPAVLSPAPGLALAAWLTRWRPPEKPQPGISRRAHVHPSAVLGRGVSIAAGATVEAGAVVGAGSVLRAGAFVGREAVLGEDCFLHPHASVLDHCLLGDRVILHAGAVVGSDGFGYVWDGQKHRKVPQIGIVRIEEDVEIGANSAIDRATLGETVIGRGTKIDNLVQIGHNVAVGEHSILCGQVGVAGSCRIGGRVTLAGQVGVSDHVEIGDGVIATGQAGIVRGAHLEAGGVFSGMPTMPHREFLRSAAWFARLPELARRVERLEKRPPDGEGGEPWKSESPKS